MATLPSWDCPVLVDGDGQAFGSRTGRPRRSCINRAWPGFTRTIYGDHKRFEETYFEPFPGYYFTGDGALRDSDATTGSPAESIDVIKRLPGIGWNR